MFIKVLLRILPFCLAALCGIASFYFLDKFGSTVSPASLEIPNVVQRSGSSTSGTGSGGGSPWFSPLKHPSSSDASGTTSRVSIISKPNAKYTDDARENNVEGTVRLKVTLLANRQIGSITPLRRLPHGLTEQAVAAARLLEFEPKKVNGVPVSTVVTIDYTFTIY